MKRSKKLIIAILVMVLIGEAFIIAGALFMTPDLTEESKNILVLASGKDEQPNGSVDMAYMVRLENGSLTNWTPVYPGGMSHPSQPAPGGLSGNMFLHDCLWDDPIVGMDFAKEIVEANTGMHADAVIIVYDEAIENIIDSARPLYVDGEVTNLSAVDVIRSNDAYNGYAGSENVPGTMSRGDAVMVLAKAIVNATKDPEKKNAMVQKALDEYSHGNILMKPEGSFTKLLATKGFERITS